MRRLRSAEIPLGRFWGRGGGGGGEGQAGEGGGGC